jgi:hypothetical protein
MARATSSFSKGHHRRFQAELQGSRRGGAAVDQHALAMNTRHTGIGDRQFVLRDG